MKTAGSSRISTTALLSKVNSQLKGERVKQENEEDDLKKYIKSLTNKTSRKGIPQSVYFPNDTTVLRNEFGTNFSPPPASPNKFIKKKSILKENSIGQSRDFPSTDDHRAGVLLTEDNLKSAQFQQQTFHRQMSEDSSIAIGRDGNKFMKASSAVQRQISRDRTESIKTDAMKKRQPSTTLELSSEEESLADFIEAMIDDEQVFGGRDSVQSLGRKPSVDFNQTEADQVESKSSVFDRSHSLRDNEDRDTGEKVVFSMNDLQVTTINREHDSKAKHFKSNSIGKRDLNDVKILNNSDKIIGNNNKMPSNLFLLKQESSGVFSAKKESISLNTSNKSVFHQDKPISDNFSATNVQKNTFVVSSNRLKQNTKDNTKQSAQSIFNKFGLHSVEDLIGSPDRSRSDSRASHNSDNIPSYPLPRAESRQVVKTVFGGYLKKGSIDKTITESIGELKSVSEIERISEDAEDDSEYSEDFDTSAHSLDGEDDDVNSKTESHFTSAMSTTRIRTSRTEIMVKTNDTEVQTEPGSRFSYMLGSRQEPVFSSFDPIPIATHVVSAETLRAISEYDPISIALHNMLRDQLQLTQDFLQSQQALYHSLTDDLRPTHHYTNLSDTRKFIRKNRRPRLTFQDALKMVSADNS